MSGRPDSSSNFAEVGGSDKQTVGIDNLPPHSHVQKIAGIGGTESRAILSDGGYPMWSTTAASANASIDTFSVGDGQPLSILNPYARVCAHVRAG